ncbi:hypothetical protein [Brevundimonas subvibrioides]|uniref:hypothetical protein n=1 Tax=Brevundimonas subvibrioides TaxID=74313 RepID=UPI0022B331B5|nr:hypothetical protein [Brevundimonas subvibrioides]
MTTPPDLQREPFRTLYVVMTEVLEKAVAAQERGEVTAAGALAEDASVLGRAIGIFANRTSSQS